MRDASRNGLEFTLDIDAPPDLAVDAARVDALVTVRARPAADPAGTPDLRENGAAAPRSAEILIMDRSLSMAGSGKLDEAKRAVCAAIDTLRDGTLLGVVAGHHEAGVVYPPGGGVLVPVDDSVRQEAKVRVAAQLASGGTAIGTWLTRARDLFAASTTPGTVCHSVLYTDGKDEHETPAQLTAALDACADRFTCDARGLGDDWNYDELLRITQKLHGGAEAVVDVGDLTEDFVRLVRQAQRVVVPRLYLGLRLSERFRVGFVRQTRPVQSDLTAQRQPHGGELHVPLGAWPPDDVRQYQISLTFESEALPLNEPVRAAAVTLLTERPDEQGGPAAAQDQPLVVRRRSRRAVELPVAVDLTRVETERELGMAMRGCADAHQRRDHAQADRELRLALRIAEQLGDARRLRLLHAVAQPGSDGRMIVRRDVARGQMQKVGLDSTRTGPVPSDAIARDEAVADADPARCPRCRARLVSAGATFCEECGHRAAAGEDG